jgi:hypothetical protein
MPPTPRQYGTDDYAVGEAQPYPQEVILAKKRLANFIRRANPRQRQLLDQNSYVAVQANELVAGEIWPLLRELSSGRVRTNGYIQDLENMPNYRRLVRPDGVLIMTDPQRGSVADFAGVRAVYAGTGWW